MKTQISSKTIRRSVALPEILIIEAIQFSDPHYKNNVNRLITTALKEFVENHKRLQFEKAMENMAQDVEVRKVCGSIENEFSNTEEDGLVS
jgi:5-methylthioribose kinase